MTQYIKPPELYDGLRLHQNENTGGCSPKVLEALRALRADQIGFYPPYATTVDACARHFGVSPDLVALTNGLSGRSTEAWLLGIRGYAFDELREEITPQARRNLDEALRFLEPVLRDRSFRAAAGIGPSPAAHQGAPG